MARTIAFGGKHASSCAEGQHLPPRNVGGGVTNVTYPLLLSNGRSSELSVQIFLCVQIIFFLRALKWYCTRKEWWDLYLCYEAHGWTGCLCYTGPLDYKISLELLWHGCSLDWPKFWLPLCSTGNVPLSRKCNSGQDDGDVMPTQIRNSASKG